MHDVSVAPPAPVAVAVDGRSARWADHRQSRRAELARAARRTVHRAGPDVSMEEIATAAGTSKSVVYRYFADKTALQLAVAEIVVQDIEAALADALAGAGSARDGLGAMVDAYLTMIEASPNVYAFVTNAGSVDSGPLTRVLDHLGELLAEPFARSGADGYAARFWGAGALGFVRGAGERWLMECGAPGAPSRAATSARITDWLWSGLPTA